MSSRYIMRRRESYFFRLRVPLDLRKHFYGKKEIRRTLNTKRYDVAKSSVRKCLYQTERLFMLLRSDMLNEEQIRKLVSGHLKQTLQESEDVRAEAPPLSPEDREEQLYLHEVFLDEAAQDLAEGRHLKIANVADIVLSGAKLLEDVPKDSPEYAKLCRELLKGIVEVALPTEIERLKGNYRNEFDRQAGYLSLLSDAGDSGTRGDEGKETLQTASSKSASEDGGQLVSKLLLAYMDDCVERERWTERSRAENEGDFGLFLRIVGDRGIKTLNREAFMELRRILKKWPANASKKPQYRGRTVKEVLAMGTDRPISASTVNKILGAVHAFMKWAVQNNYAEKNFAEGLTVSTKNVREDKKREIYTLEDLQRLFRSPVYTEKQPSRLTKQHPERYWLPLVGLYSGMRLGEGAQLYASDIVEVDGVPCFDINDAEEKQLKNAASRRTVPVHPFLLELGFMDYVQQVRAEKKERLWGSLIQKGRGYGQDFSRFYGRLNRKHVTTHPRKNFHSFRHTFINAAKQLQVPEPIIKELVGHSLNSITLGVYGKQYEARTLLAELSKLNFGIEDELRKKK